ncbi:MAG: hypothetical protein QNJ54_22515 [Prochloraceae cyanobacterium]|nr:hypothetical protein [Prochloraceae cyanobacterium]
MNQLTVRDRLYKLLPAIYKLRDTTEGEPLRALLAAIEIELNTIEKDIANLYDNWFIETCQDWVVPYIGDLLDVRELYADNIQSLTAAEVSGKRIYGQREWRAYVANTLAYRRRKGTAPILEQLARDLTGWRSRAVEFGRLVSTTQNLNHVITNSTLVNLRADNYLQIIGTPFERQAAYSAEIRPASRGGRYNVPNIGLLVWRLQSYPIEKSTAGRINQECYTFNPLGYDDLPLFNQPQTETDIVTLAQEINVPGMLRIPPLANELKQRRELLWQGKRPEGIRYFDSDPVLQIFIDGQSDPIPPEEILICSLENKDEETSAERKWRMPNYEGDRLPGDPPLPTQVVAVDPTLGRIRFLDRPFPQRVEVSYFYGFSDDLGGGSYSRDEAENILPASQAPGKIYPSISEVERVNSADPNPLAVAIETWNQKVTAWQGLQDSTNVPLAKIAIPSIRITKRNIKSEKFRPSFSPGIINGLSVIGNPRSNRVIVTPGQAIDNRGRLITLSQEISITLNPEKYDIADYPDQKGFLVIFYRSYWQRNPQKTQQQLPIEFLPETAIDDLEDSEKTFIPLARLEVDSQFRLVRQPENLEIKFRAGIVRGLEVKVFSEKLEAIVTPGMAVDKQGRGIAIAENFSVDFNNRYLGTNTNQWLILSQSRGFLTPRWQIELVNSEEIDPDRHYIQLEAFNNIPKIQIDRIEELTNLDVKAVNPDRAIIEISRGTVTDSSGTEIQLEQSSRLDLSAYHGQTLTLFISSQTGQGLLPLKPVDPVGEEWRNLGIVPQEPQNNLANTEIILIKDSRTYEGNLDIVIPPKKQLKIIALNEHRPHLQGNIYVRGTADDKDTQPGELLCNGLLIEGNLIVRSGNLQRLQISHCTLVPEKSQLKVQSSQQLFEDPETTQPETIDLIGLLIYCLNLVWQSIRRDLGWKNSSDRYNLTQFSQLYSQQLQSIVALMEKNIWGWSRSTDGEKDGENIIGKIIESCFCPQVPTPTGGDNSRLEVILDRSICGSILLADTVPKLKIEDSIIDKKNYRDKQQREISGVALFAGGADADIHSSTVLGTTTVKTIEASNSIFTEKVTVFRRQIGCIRFSYVSATSQTPRRYRCQPDLALSQQLDTLPQAITSFAIDTKSGSGTISNEPGDAKKIIGDNTNFCNELEKDSVIIAIQDGEKNITQTRTVTEIQTEDILTVDKAFDPPLTSETTFKIPFLFAGTLGNGIFHSFNNGDRWENISKNLSNLYVTAIIFTYSQNETTTSQNDKITVFAGTTDGKVYRSQINQAYRSQNDENIDWTQTILRGNNTAISPLLGDKDCEEKLWAATSGNGVWQTNDNGENWTQIKEGLTNLNVTSLAVNSKGKVFAGTAGNGVFLYTTETSQNRETSQRWISFNTGLTNFDITVLIADVEGQLFNGQLFAGTKNGGVFYYSDNRNRWVEINQNLTSLNITDLVACTYKDEELLFAVTDDGQLFRSFDRGINWQKLSLDLKGTAIAVLEVDKTNGDLFLGTAAGNIMRSQDGGDNWLSIDRGLTNVAQKLLIMASLQPSFTSAFYGDPGYAQLSQNCALEIRTGAEDGSEMGVFNSLKQPQRQDNLQANLKEYLRFGLQVGTFYIT